MPRLDLSETCLELTDFLIARADGDELVEDSSWSLTRRGPSLAELLQRVEVRHECLGAASAVRHLLPHVVHFFMASLRACVK